MLLIVSFHILCIEPTSALDPDSSSLVENFLADELASAESPLKAMVWVTHSKEQGDRVGTRHLKMGNEDNGHHMDV
jgi:ABC-type iron transport system FetAB ATPase subunit